MVLTAPRCRLAYEEGGGRGPVRPRRRLVIERDPRTGIGFSFSFGPGRPGGLNRLHFSAAPEGTEVASARGTGRAGWASWEVAPSECRYSTRPGPPPGGRMGHYGVGNTSAWRGASRVPETAWHLSLPPGTVWPSRLRGQGRSWEVVAVRACSFL